MGRLAWVKKQRGSPVTRINLALVGDTAHLLPIRGAAKQQATPTSRASKIEPASRQHTPLHTTESRTITPTSQHPRLFTDLFPETLVPPPTEPSPHAQPNAGAGAGAGAENATPVRPSRHPRPNPRVQPGPPPPPPEPFGTCPNWGTWAQQGQRLAYYPSCGHQWLWVVMRLDCDVFVFSEKRPSHLFWPRLEADFARVRQPVQRLYQDARQLVFCTANGKTGWVFFEDNNDTLLRLHQAQLKVHHFVGICDGCCEGGNWECVNENPFLGKLLTLVAPDGMDYTTDHAHPLHDPQLSPRHPRGFNPFAPRQHEWFVSHQYWQHFPPPSQLRGGNWRPERWQAMPTLPSTADVRFELAGVLVAPTRAGEVRDYNFRPEKHHLAVMPYNGLPHQLNKLSPFRTRAGRGVLAQYRVTAHLSGLIGTL